MREQLRGFAVPLVLCHLSLRMRKVRKKFFLALCVLSVAGTTTSTSAQDAPDDGESRPWTKVGTDPDGRALCTPTPCHPPTLMCCL